MLVDTVDSIHRLRWDKIERPSPYLMDMNAPITGTADVDNQTVMIADFETIVSQILGMEGALDLPEDSVADEATDKSARILLADDSFILRATLTSILKKHGYENLTVCSDGQEAWETLEASRGAGAGL